MINVSGLMDNAGITDWAYGVVVYIDAYFWDFYSDKVNLHDSVLIISGLYCNDDVGGSNEAEYEINGVVVYIDAYWDEYNDTIESIQVTEIIDDGSFESYYNLDGWNFGVVVYIDAYIDMITDSGPAIESDQATELWNNGSLVSDWNINVDDEYHRFGVVNG